MSGLSQMFGEPQYLSGRGRKSMQAQATRRTAPVKIGFCAGHDFKRIGHVESQFSISKRQHDYNRPAEILGRDITIKGGWQLQQNKLIVVRHVQTPTSTARIIVVVHDQQYLWINHIN